MFNDLIIYQIYPRSFKDSNNDGIGDLKGIIEKIPYLAELGINAIWMSPIYASPNDDNGYDVSDYYSIMNEFGTMEDFDLLKKTCDKYNIKIIMDLVMNHTSDEHKWFKEARKSKDNPYSDYYIFVDNHNKEPNNWESCFGGSAWEYVKERDQFYLHLFSKKQPDLNWDNPKMRKELYQMIQFWIDKGVQGFRIDAISYLKKPEGFPNSPFEEDKFGHAKCMKFIAGNLKTHQYIKEMCETLFIDKNIFTVGEVTATSDEDIKQYVLKDNHEFSAIIPFVPPIVEIHQNKPIDLKKRIFKMYDLIKDQGYIANFLSNHDKPRQVSLYGNDQEYLKDSSKALASLMHTLPGIPFIYQGEEIGMSNVYYENIEDYNDLDTLNIYHKSIKEGKSKEEAFKLAQIISRDNARSPMQWDDSLNAGFSSCSPWLKVNPNYKDINVKQQIGDPDSVLNYYKKSIHLRKNNPCLLYGDLKEVKTSDDVISFTRTYQNKIVLVIISLTSKELPYDFNFKENDILLTNKEFKKGVLLPYQALIVNLKTGK